MRFLSFWVLIINTAMYAIIASIIKTIKLITILFLKNFLSEFRIFKNVESSMLFAATRLTFSITRSP